MKASNKEIIEQAEWIAALAGKIRDAAHGIEKTDEPGRRFGCINNLAPELSKAASKIKQMTKWGWKS